MFWNRQQTTAESSMYLRRCEHRASYRGKPKNGPEPKKYVAVLYCDHCTIREESWWKRFEIANNDTWVDEKKKTTDCACRHTLWTEAMFSFYATYMKQSADTDTYWKSIPKYAMKSCDSRPYRVVSKIASSGTSASNIERSQRKSLKLNRNM